MTHVRSGIHEDFDLFGSCHTSDAPGSAKVTSIEITQGTSPIDNLCIDCLGCLVQCAVCGQDLPGRTPLNHGFPYKLSVNMDNHLDD